MSQTPNATYQHNILITGAIGLLGAVVLTVGCVGVMGMGWVTPRFEQPLFVVLFFAFLGAFSVAEIPVMIFGIHKMAQSSSQAARYVAIAANLSYPLFGAVYAAPLILLTGYVWLGVGLSSLSMVRFITAIIFLPRLARSAASAKEAGNKQDGPS